MPDKSYIKGGIEYDFTVSLINNNDPNKGEVFKFNPNAIIELAISDNFFEWFSKGYMVFLNTQEALERGDSDKKTGFKFRGDGYDLLIVSIKPKSAEDKYLLEYKFAIYDFEDIKTNSNVEKYKKIFFWDLDYQLMMDRNLAWASTGAKDFKEKKKLELFSMSNYERGLSGDKLLRYFIEDVCGYKERIDDDKWQKCAPENKIFYVSPSQNYLDDDLDEILSKCVSDDSGDYGTMIFKKERTASKKKNGKFTFQSLKNYFEKAKPDQYFIENFYLQSPGTQIMPSRSPDANDDRNQSIILSYQYAQAAGIDNSKAYQISPQSFYSHGSGQFNWDATWNTPSVSKSHVANEMVDKLKKKGDSAELTLATLNNWKKQDSFTQSPSYNGSTNRFGRLASGRNKIIESMLLLNDTLTFDVRGLTKRESGRFVGVDMIAGIADVDFDNRLCGQWFVLSATHLFTQSDYVNTISCVKIHTYEDKNPIKQELDPNDLNKDGWPD